MAMLKGKAEVRIFYESLIALLMEKPIVNDTLEREGNQVSNHTIFRLDAHYSQTYLCAITK